MSVPPSVVCTLEGYSGSVSDPSIHCLTRGQSIGVVVRIESGLISLVAVVGVFILIIRNGIRHVRRTGKWHLVQEPMDVLMLSLFGADLIQAVGAVMDIQWVHSGVVAVGPFCTAQGVVQQLGETSAAMITLLITLFTFAGVWFRAGSTSLATVLVVLVWLYVILIIAIGNATHGSHSLFESPTPYWCWLGQRFLGFRLAGEYVWFWINLAAAITAYLILFLWERGNITISDTVWWRFSMHRSSTGTDATGTDTAGTETTGTDAAERVQRQRAYTKIAYPVCYCVLLIPLSVARWIGFVQERGGRMDSIPSAATFGVISLYGLSGASNVVLLLSTKPNSMLFGGWQGGAGWV
ncbi:hypothetical protein C8F04DRAFT_623175 [Mycena alexandri]|uniref:Glucose receptor Git3 N-terminal domain-containing protein n=1 Tax=Mycena alexandri TaxID=1745969 RepID=A0AAD6X5X8_9AGAR|nr:hypothetical protein C8F04DRAFT_623175 [Mycena alexandri]